jgi:hypothetical protein
MYLCVNNIFHFQLPTETNYQMQMKRLHRLKLTDNNIIARFIIQQTTIHSLFGAKHRAPSSTITSSSSGPAIEFTHALAVRAAPLYHPLTYDPDFRIRTSR